MSKEAFMKELEYLLSDIPDEDKKDALDYYRDYLDEAGDMAQKAIEEFGSPERIAAIVRSDIRGDLEDGGAFTERGYEDERFRVPNYQVVKRYDLPEEREKADRKPADTGHEGGGAGAAFGDRSSQSSMGSQNGWRSPKDMSGQEGTTGQNNQNESSWKSAKSTEDPRERSGSASSGSQGPIGSGDQGKLLKILLFAVLVVVALPILLGIGGGILGAVVGVISLFFALLVVLAAVTIALILAGVGLCVAGVIAMFTNLLNGLFCFGTGLIVLAFGQICLVISVWFYGKLVPWLIRGCVNGISSLIHRKESRA